MFTRAKAQRHAATATKAAAGTVSALSGSSKAKGKAPPGCLSAELVT